MAVIICNRLRNVWQPKKQSKIDVPLNSLLQTGLYNLQTKVLQQGESVSCLSLQQESISLGEVEQILAFNFSQQQELH